MGNSESTPSGGGITSAYHVLRVAESSPAALVGIEPFFDFLCGVNGIQIGDEIDGLTGMLQQNEGRQIILQIWSSKRKELRDVPVVPSRAWSSTAGSKSTPSLLGLSLRLCNPQLALDQVWHVLEILSGSPAESAGLVPFGDYIIGTSSAVLKSEGDFYDTVEASIDRPLRLYVYNSDYDVTRETVLIPNREWGGEGLLGCGVGYGMLHRVPRPQDRIGGILQAGTPYIESETFDANNSHYQSSPSNYQNPSNNSRRPSDGFQEASYASAGVEIVAREEEDSYYATPSRQGSSAMNNGYSYAPPRSSQLQGIAPIGEESEDLV